MTERLVYLASPYSDSDPEVMQERFEATCRAAGRLIEQGIPVFSPIAHSHHIAMQAGMDQRSEAWYAADSPLLAACTELVVLMLDGWEESTGVRHEIAAAKAAGKPVFYMDPVINLVEAHVPSPPNTLPYLPDSGIATVAENPLPAYSKEEEEGEDERVYVMVTVPGIGRCLLTDLAVIENLPRILKQIVYRELVEIRAAAQTAGMSDLCGIIDLELHSRGVKTEMEELP